MDLKSDLFTYEIDQAALTLAKALDGKLLLVTSLKDMTPLEVLKRDKSLTDSEIAPVLHRLPERIKVHARICFTALILHRVMRSRLKLAGSWL